MAKIMVNLTLNNFFVFTDNENDADWFDSIKTLTRNELETHKIKFGGNKLETYILKIFEEKNLIKSGEFILKKIYIISVKRKIYRLLYIMHLTFKLSFEHFDFNDEEFLNDLKHIYH